MYQVIPVQALECSGTFKVFSEFISTPLLCEKGTGPHTIMTPIWGGPVNFNLFGMDYLSIEL